MRIAVVGWGSLIWSSRDLAVTTRWRPGPDLSVEFARLSSGGRVTLVLLPSIAASGTWWARSAFDDVDAAGENLARRERCRPGDVHWTTGHGLRTHRDDAASPASADASGAIGRWLATRPDLDAAVWTGLPPEGFARWQPGDLAADVVDHLRGRRGEERRRAREYVQCAPATVRTPVRTAVEDALGWVPTPLPSHLFDPGGTTA